MKRFLIVAIALLSLAASHPFQRSVFPLVASVYDHNYGLDVWENICTAFSIDPTNGWFMTAAHCVVGGPRFIGERRYMVVLQEMDEVNDIAVVWSNQPAVGLRLREKPLQFEEEVRIPSYQLGMWTFMLTKGQVINPGTTNSLWTKSYMLHSAPSCQGASGAPIVDRRGKVVGVEQVGVMRIEPCSDIGGGSTLEQLHKFRSYFRK